MEMETLLKMLEGAGGVAAPLALAVFFVWKKLTAIEIAVTSIDKRLAIMEHDAANHPMPVAKARSR